MKFRSLIFSVWILWQVAIIFAQSTHATVSGVVVDPAGAVLPDASVEIVNELTGVHYSSRANALGIYAVTILPPGEYRVEVSKVGFKTIIKPGIVLNVQSAVALNFTLPLGATSESITVESGASTINTANGSVSTVIDREFVANMPLNGRSFQELLTLAPGVFQVATSAGLGYGVGYSGDIVVNGQRAESNYFTVDGVSANVGAQSSGAEGAGVSGSLPAYSALGTTQGLASIDDLQEFRSNTSTYSAEYGRNPGGQFSFSTRSGTNTLHGSLYDYLRNDALDANNWFNNNFGYSKGKEKQNDFGGTFAGPLVVPGIYKGKNRTFFFFSYEGLRLTSPQAATQVEVPEDSLRAQAPSTLQPLLRSFPSSNGGSDGKNDGFGYFIESVSFPSGLNSSSIRLDHTIGTRLNFFGRYADTPSNAATYSAAVEQLVQNRTQSATFGATAAVTSHQSNELRFNFTRSYSRSAARSTALGGAVPFDVGNLPGPGGNPFPRENSVLAVIFDFADYTNLLLDNFPQSQDQWNVNDTHTWIVRNHSLKAGLDWRLLRTHLLSQSPLEEVAFSTESEVLKNTPGFGYVQTFGSPTDNQPEYRNISSFLEDEWRVSPQLSLSAGLRWDINPSPGNANGPVPYTVTEVSDLASTQVAPQRTPLWKTDWLGLAPRVGMAYKIQSGASSNTVLRAGFGVFYDPGNTLGSQGYQGIGFSSSAVIDAASFPLNAEQLTLPTPSVQAPYTGYIYGYDPNLRLPYSLQYNFALEQAFGQHDSLTLGYVGSGAHRLLTTFQTSPAALGNPYFSSSATLDVTQGRAASNFNSLQIKYQRALSHGVQALLSYTYSHSIDNASSNFGIFHLLRASSDFDLRHNLQAAFTYLTPSLHANKTISQIANAWGLDFRFQARTAQPVDIIGNQQLDPATATLLQYQPDRVQGEPLYRYDPSFPGGRAINFAAFPDCPRRNRGRSSRNPAQGFGLVQLDTAIHRDLPLRDQFHLQMRVEAFNLFNHPMFGPIYSYLSYGPGLFGTAYNTANSVGNLNSLYQAGGPRSLQISLKAKF